METGINGRQKWREIARDKRFDPIRNFIELSRSTDSCESCKLIIPHNSLSLEFIFSPERLEKVKETKSYRHILRRSMKTEDTLRPMTYRVSPPSAPRPALLDAPHTRPNWNSPGTDRIPDTRAEWGRTRPGKIRNVSWYLGGNSTFSWNLTFEHRSLIDTQEI